MCQSTGVEGDALVIVESASPLNEDGDSSFNVEGESSVTVETDPPFNV
jgi:hypothetical protein